MEEFFAANCLSWADRAKLHSTDQTGMTPRPSYPLSFTLKALKRR